MLRPLLAAALLVAGTSTGLTAATPATAAAPASAQAQTQTQTQETAPLELRVLSGRADLVSAGDALVEVVLPAGASVDGLRVRAGERDVTAAFTTREGRTTGRVAGLPLGATTLTARLADGRGAALELVNHPKGGPLFAGPQVQPWFCSTEDSALGAPLDEQCNAPTQVSYVYEPSDGGGFAPYDPQDPPSDVGTTTTDEGKQVPYIVRVERGTLNRSIYDIALLWDPSKPAAEQDAWNHKLGYTFGGGCAPNHNQTENSDAVLDDLYLDRGFAVASSGLNVLGNNCNEVVSAETMTMVKERLIEQYGEIRYTIGNGCSGGSIQQNVIAAQYPGLLDGIQPSCTYPDSYTTGTEVIDCSLLLSYLDSSALFPPGSPQRAQVLGQQSEGPCRSWREVFGFDRTVGDPTIGCDGLVLGAQQPTYSRPDYVYDAEQNPEGARCTKQDYERSIVGTGPDGKAPAPYDNTGVQYGLKALQSGSITAAQFLDLNEQVGGFDIDFGQQDARSAADPGVLRALYRSGRINDGQQLANVPIIDLRGADNYEIHTDYNSYVLRERLERANGTSANHVLFTAETPLVIPPAVTEEALVLIDQWLASIEADGSADPLSEKVLRHRPAAAVDSCYINGEKITDQATCRTAFPYFASPRIAADGPFTNDNLKCRLRPIDPEEYDGALSPAQVEQLEEIFPDGVCDYTVPGVEQSDAAGTWHSFADGPGGKPLGPPPVSTPLPTTSPEPPGRLVAQARALDAACPPGRVPGNSREDDDGNTHEAAIDCMVWWQIAEGTSGTAYAPTEGVTRAQLASFVARLIERSGGQLPADAPNAFSDDDGLEPHEKNIDKLAAAGIVAGTGEGRFDPFAVVTRAQMAKFLVNGYEHRSVEALAARGDFFPDDDGNELEAFINRAAAAGFTGGREGRYEPAAPVLRDAMASFLARDLDLLVAEGTARPKQ